MILYVPTTNRAHAWPKASRGCEAKRQAGWVEVSEYEIPFPVRWCRTCFPEKANDAAPRTANGRRPKRISA